MATSAILVIGIILIALVLFVTEWISIDLVALGIVVALILTGVVSLREGLEGFSNPATITVAFMFVLSAALLKTGALQYVTHQLTDIFTKNLKLGVLLMMVLVAVISAFVNNTPVVAVFIPVVIQIAHDSKISPTKLLIPLSFASIMGGMCTLIGTSTNLVVNGILIREGVDEIGMFQMTGVAIILLVIGVVYMVVAGLNLLPNREVERNLGDNFGMKDYLTDFEIIPGSKLDGQKIMDSNLVRKLDMDILEVLRNGVRFNLPPGDFELLEGDILKVRCSAEKIQALKTEAKIIPTSDLAIGDHRLNERSSTIVELVITTNAAIEGFTLRAADFRRRFRAAPLAIRQREEVLHDNLYDVELQAGDVILADVKSHFVQELKQMEAEQDAPFAIISESKMVDFERRGFFHTLFIVAGAILLASLGVVNIAVGVILAVIALVLLKKISMKEAYEAINWKIVFVMAGVLSLGVGLKNTGLDVLVADGLVDALGSFGPIAVLSGIYLATSLFTDVVSNTATAALMTPIALTTASVLGLSPLPFIIAVMFASSASFITPIGYQTNTMVYGAGQYKFTDFMRVGVWLNILFWILATLLIPLFFPF